MPPLSQGYGQTWRATRMASTILIGGSSMAGHTQDISNLLVNQRLAAASALSATWATMAPMHLYRMYLVLSCAISCTQFFIRHCHYAFKNSHAISCILMLRFGCWLLCPLNAVKALTIPTSGRRHKLYKLYISAVIAPGVQRSRGQRVAAPAPHKCLSIYRKIPKTVGGQIETHVRTCASSIRFLI